MAGLGVPRARSWSSDAAVDNSLQHILVRQLGDHALTDVAVVCPIDRFDEKVLPTARPAVVLPDQLSPESRRQDPVVPPDPRPREVRDEVGGPALVGAV